MRYREAAKKRSYAKKKIRIEFLRGTSLLRCFAVIFASCIV